MDFGHCTFGKHDVHGGLVSMQEVWGHLFQIMSHTHHKVSQTVLGMQYLTPCHTGTLILSESKTT